jgi:spore coat protein CotH
MKNKRIHILILLSLMLGACSNSSPETTTKEAAPAVDAPIVVVVDDPSPEAEETETQRPANWSEETHSNDADPNYEVVFPEDKVNQITITISPENWAAMQADLAALFGEQGAERIGGPPGGGQAQRGERPQAGEGGDFQPPAGFGPPENGERPAMPGGGGGGNMTSENPMWVEATIEFDGNIWTNVGVRYKGNSSLRGGWSSGTAKLPLKLDFDEFEDEYPEIDDQRFYGFKQLSLANGYKDSSLMRDAVSAQILEEAGLPSAETAFYEVVLDYGEGPVSLGLYTMIEVIDDTAIERYFGEDEGNIYEADGSAASFAANTYNQIEASFEKENNTDSDWSDIEALFNILHAELRTEDPAAWRAELGALFDVDGFLEWLAISAVIEHWDAYGNMIHNYYLYNDPQTGQINWISWDHNETLSTSTGGGNRAVSLDKSEVGENWPLIRFLLDDPVYYELYINYLTEIVAGAFNADHMAETYQNIADLIAPYAAADVGEEAFSSAVRELIDYTYQRTEAVDTFLSNSGN